MVVRRVRRLVGVTARVARRTGEQVKKELLRLEKSGVLSRRDVGRLLSLVRHEAVAAGKRVTRFVASEVKHDLSLAQRLARAAAERSRKARDTGTVMPSPAR